MVEIHHDVARLSIFVCFLINYSTSKLEWFTKERYFEEGFEDGKAYSFHQDSRQWEKCSVEDSVKKLPVYCGDVNFRNIFNRQN